MKVAIIGSGSTYTPEIVNGFLDRTDKLPVEELWLMDIDAERLAIVGGFAQRMAEAKGNPFRVVLSDNRRETLAGASYVVTQFRVGHMEARRNDEYLGKRHGLIGQETTGVGGMAKALRTIPVMLDIARDIRELAPKALLVSFTNPSGLVTQALHEHAPDIAAVGVCNAPYGAKMKCIELLEKELGMKIAPERVELNTLGLNHLSWHRGLTLDGEDVWPRIMQAYIQEMQDSSEPEWDPNLLARLRMIPNYYLKYFYCTVEKLAMQEKWPPSRAEEVMAIEKELLAEYSNPALREAPADLMKRGGAYYSTVATQLLTSHHRDLGEIHVANVPHRGAVAGWPEGWVLEMPCRVDSNGVTPLPAEPLPPVCFGLIAQVKSFEMLTIDAAVRGDRTAAFEALLAHPLGPKDGKVEEVLDDMLEMNRPYLPQFFTGVSE